MSQIVVGLDIGAWSIKAVKFRVRYKKTEIIGFHEIKIPRANNPEEDFFQERLKEALQEMRTVFIEGVEDICCHLQEDNISTRVLELPKSAERHLEQVLKFELEGLTPFNLDEMVYDYLKLSSKDSEKVRVMVSIAPRQKVKDILDILTILGIEPKEIAHGALVYRELLTQSDLNQVVLDIGHERTNICVLNQGLPELVRTIIFGGRNITAKIAQRLKITYEQAEELKIERANLSEGDSISEISREVLGLLLVELKRTLASWRVNSGKDIDRVLVCGGGSMILGLSGYLEEGLGVEAVLFSPSFGSSSQVYERETVMPLFVKACALGIQAAKMVKKERINFRQGDLAFRPHYGFLRTKFIYLGLLLLSIICSWIFSAYARYSVLSMELERREERCRILGREILGKDIGDCRRIAGILKGKFKEKSPLPKADAFDIIEEISKRIPPFDKLRIDVERLHIEPGRIQIQGLVDTMAAVDEIYESLKGYDCFLEIKKGRVVQAPGSERKKFTLDIKSRCP
jgi:general secretion pathway protein L